MADFTLWPILVCFILMIAHLVLVNDIVQLCCGPGGPRQMKKCCLYGCASVGFSFAGVDFGLFYSLRSGIFICFVSRYLLFLFSMGILCAGRLLDAIISGPRFWCGEIVCYGEASLCLFGSIIRCKCPF